MSVVNFSILYRNSEKEFVRIVIPIEEGDGTIYTDSSGRVYNLNLSLDLFII